MDARPIIAVADLADALRDLTREGDELLALEPDMLLDQSEGSVRQELDALQDHSVELQRIVLVAGGEDGNGLRRDLACVFRGDHLRHREFPGESRGMKESLGEAVAKRGVQGFVGMREAIHLLGMRAKLADVASHEL